MTTNFDQLLHRAGLVAASVTLAATTVSAQHNTSAFKVEISKLGKDMERHIHDNGSMDAYSACNINQPNIYVAQPTIIGTSYTEESEVFFGYGDSTLTKSQMAVLDKIVVFLKQNPTARAHLFAYTDTSGDDAFNVKLAKARNKTVLKYLERQGAPLKSLTIEATGFGEDPKHLPVKTSNNKALADNRKVKVTFTFHAPGQEIINCRFIHISDKSPLVLTVTDKLTPVLETIAKNKLKGYNFTYESVPAVFTLDPSTSTPRTLNIKLQRAEDIKKIALATTPSTKGEHPNCRIAVYGKEAKLEVQDSITKNWKTAITIISEHDLSTIRIADIGPDGNAAWRSHGKPYRAGTGTDVTPTQLTPNYIPLSGQKPKSTTPLNTGRN